MATGCGSAAPALLTRERRNALGTSRIATRTVRITAEAYQGDLLAYVEVRRFGGDYRTVDVIGSERLDLRVTDLLGIPLHEVVRVVCERIAL